MQLNCINKKTDTGCKGFFCDEYFRSYNGVLVEVVVGAAGYGVESHEVVKVGHVSADPLLGESRRLEESGRLVEADTVEVGWVQRHDGVVHLLHNLCEGVWGGGGGGCECERGVIQQLKRTSAVTVCGTMGHTRANKHAPFYWGS